MNQVQPNESERNCRPDKDNLRYQFFAIAALIAGRLILLLSSSPTALRGFGDFYNFFQLAVTPGWPFFDYWVEYPPLFPFLTEILVAISGSKEHVFDIILYLILTIFDAANLVLFNSLLHILDDKKWLTKLAVFLWVMLMLPYYWWYFDSIAVFFLLLGLLLILRKKYWLAGIFFGLGGLVKIIPLIGITAAWKKNTWRRFLLIGASSLGVLGTGLIFLWLISPEYTSASLASQGNKGSWATAWAVLDGNYRIGLLNNMDDRLLPEKAYDYKGNPPAISPLITAVITGLIGLKVMHRKDPVRPGQALAMAGFFLALLFLWFPGWSVQWVLYMIPLVLLVFDLRRAVFYTLIIILINITEYPVLLTRELYWTINITALIRAFYWIRIAVSFYQRA